MKTALTVVVALLFAALMAYAMSWTVRGWVAAWTWNGDSPLSCYGSTVVSLRHRHARGPIDAAGDCELKLDECHLDGPLSASGNAKVSIRGGHLRSLRVLGGAHVRIQGGHVDSLSLSGSAVVGVEGATVGHVERGGAARVTGLPAEEARQAAADLSQRFGARACDGVIECYKTARAFGNISGRVTATVGPDGRMTQATYEGDAAAPIRDCLVENARHQTIPGYDGQRGVLTCEWAGQMAGGSHKLLIGGGYQRAE